MIEITIGYTENMNKEILEVTSEYLMKLSSIGTKTASTVEMKYEVNIPEKKERKKKSTVKFPTPVPMEGIVTEVVNEFPDIGVPIPPNIEEIKIDPPMEIKKEASPDQDIYSIFTSRLLDAIRLGIIGHTDVLLTLQKVGLNNLQDLQANLQFVQQVASLLNIPLIKFGEE